MRGVLLGEGIDLEEPCPSLQGWDSDLVEEDVCGPQDGEVCWGPTVRSERQGNYRKSLAGVRVTLGGKLPLGCQQNWRMYATGSFTHYWQSSLLLAGKSHADSDTVRARGKDWNEKWSPFWFAGSFQCRLLTPNIVSLANEKCL